MIWIARDTHFPMRVERKLLLLFRLKRLLLQWGWQRFEVRVDLHTRKLTIADQDVFCRCPRYPT